MASLSLKHIFKVYDNRVKAVNDFSMDIDDNEFIVFVGPSGCGKSTTLRMIAGLEDITAGELRIDDEIVNDFEPKDRNIAMVFQNYALYPHMSVYENMAFSLRTNHEPNDVIHQKVMEAAEILGITEYLERKPKALSGGQRQRVALGRAIVRNPKVFLLDEPLSNLDAKLRTAMRTEISRLHERLGTTFIYVTHDQVEAMTMGTRIVVMKDGYIQQIDTPVNLFKYPDNVFVAGFIGTPQMNFFDGTILKQGENVTFKLDCGTSIDMKYTQADKVPLKYMDGSKKIIFGVRPDDVRIKEEGENDDAWAYTKAVVGVVEVLGGEALIYGNLNLETPDAEFGSIIIKADPDVDVKRGDIIDIKITRRKFHVFDKVTEKSIRRRIPEENIVKCNIENTEIKFEGQSFKLPDAIKTNDIQDVELSFPVKALTLGTGSGIARIEWIEKIENQTLYFLKAGELTLFALEDNDPKYSISDIVKFDIDLSKINIPECNIKAVNLINRLDGSFIKLKNKEKNYDFFMNMEGMNITPSNRICEKLFACKGAKIFNTDLVYEFSLKDILVSKLDESENKLTGTVTKVYDYTNTRFVEIQIGNQMILAEYSGEVGDQVQVKLDVDKVTIIDKQIDIIIV